MVHSLNMCDPGPTAHITENIMFFPWKVFWDFQKWTKKMSKNGFSQNTFLKIHVL
jgi:hypothetical protein